MCYAMHCNDRAISFLQKHRGFAGRYAVLHTENDLARALLRLYTEAALIAEECVVVEYGRGPAIPWIVVLCERVLKALCSRPGVGSRRSLTDL